MLSYREGRAALVSSFGVFKYMALYSVIQFVTVVILYWVRRGFHVSSKLVTNLVNGKGGAKLILGVQLLQVFTCNSRGRWGPVKFVEVKVH